MTIEKTDKGKFIYITYARQGVKDVDLFKTALLSELSNKDSIKDIIVDFGMCKYLTSPEIGILVRAATSLKGSPRIVRVIPCEGLYKQMLSVNLTKVDHLTIYKDRQDFAQQLKAS